MRKLIHAALVAALVALAGGPAGAQPRGNTKQYLPTVNRWTLDNGLEIAYVGVKGAPVVSVQVWYRAGSKDDPRDRRGLARMFQYLLFDGSAHVRPGAHQRIAAMVGGYATAQAIEDATATQNVVPSQYFDLIMRLEADRMRGLEWTKTGVEAARSQALADLQRAMADPFKRAVAPFLALAYQKHPYAWEAFGVADEVRKVTMDDLKSFYDRYYQPSNALLVVVGDVNKATVNKTARAYFGGLAKTAVPTHAAAKQLEAEPAKARRKQIAPGQVGLVLRGYPIPEATHKDIYALQVLSIVLGTGPGSRLVDNLSKAGLARQAGATALVREHPGLFLLYAAFDNGASGDKVETSLFDQVKALAAKPPTAADLRKARALIVSDFSSRIESDEGLAGQVGMSWVLTHDPSQFTRDIAELEAVTGADIAHVISTYLTPERSITVVSPPGKR